MLKFHYSGGRFVQVDKSAAKQPADKSTPIHFSVKIQPVEKNPANLQEPHTKGISAPLERPARLPEP
jgi:hypothetical protein